MCKIIEDLIDSEKKEIAKYFGLTLEQVEELERSQYVQL